MINLKVSGAGVVPRELWGSPPGGKLPGVHGNGTPFDLVRTHLGCALRQGSSRIAMLGYTTAPLPDGCADGERGRCAKQNWQEQQEPSLYGSSQLRLVERSWPITRSRVGASYCAVRF
jgi:hypothetical protein